MCWRDPGQGDSLVYACLLRPLPPSKP
jgi:hypothetical protein